MPIFNFVKIDGSVELLREEQQRYDKYVNSLGNGQEVEAKYYTPGEMRTLLSNRYMWGGVYPPFIPFLSDTTEVATVNDVHEHFTEMLLYQVDILDTNDKNSVDYLNELISGNKIKRFVKQSKIGDGRIQFEWIQSTASLTKKEMSDYIDNIICFGLTVDVQVQDAKDFHNK